MQCANVGPACFNYDETLNTLRYASRAKNIKNKARINEDPKDALLRQFQKEIEDLRRQLEEGNRIIVFFILLLFTLIITGNFSAGSDDSSDESGDDTELRKEKRKKHMSESERATLRVKQSPLQIRQSLI